MEVDFLPSALRDRIRAHPPAQHGYETRAAELNYGKLSEILPYLRPNFSSEVIVFCSDHGVATRQVTTLPPNYASQQFHKIKQGEGIACILGSIFSIPVLALDCSSGAPTNDICEMDAMSEEDLYQCMTLGWEVGINLKSDILGVGELGAGNTTAASALACWFLDEVPANCVGRGSGIPDHIVPEKLNAVEMALARSRSSCGSTMDALRSLAGKEMVSICGAILGAHYAGKLIVLDGFVTCVAALAAVRIWPEARKALICCTSTEEKGQLLVVRRLGLTPFMQLGHTCGQGFGCFFSLNFCRVASQLAEKAEAPVVNTKLAH